MSPLPHSMLVDVPHLLAKDGWFSVGLRFVCQCDGVYVCMWMVHIVALRGACMHNAEKKCYVV